MEVAQSQFGNVTEAALGETQAAAASDPVSQTPRGCDVLLKHQRVAEFLEDEGYDAVLLECADNFSWFTSGGSCGAATAAVSRQAALFITPEYRCVLADNSVSCRIFQEEIAGLGFQLKEWPWWEQRQRVYNDICRGRKVASDTGTSSTRNEADKLRRLRINLTALEQKRLEELGGDVAHAAEATARNSRPDISEYEIAAEVSHRMVRHGITPVQLHVAGLDAFASYRLPIPKDRPVQRGFTLSVTGARHGLCATATRTLFFHQSDTQFMNLHNICTMVDATFVFFSQPDETGSSVLRRARRIYEKLGWPHEWRQAPQGGITGYSPCEVPIIPDSPFRFRAGMAVTWTPSIGPARCGDTSLITEAGYAIMTPCQQWPTISVSVKGYEVIRPTVLVLDL